MDVRGELPRFRDPSGEQEPYGFVDPFFSRPGLPGIGWEAGNMFDTTTFMPNCNMEDAVFNDTVWGMGHDGRLELQREAPIFTRIFYSDAMRRLQAVEQLTLPPEYSTIPNTAAFSRFEHIWGSVLFVKKLAEHHGIDEPDRVKLQLRTLLSDMAHTVGSHMGDWLFQGVGKAENQHDIELSSYLEATGITDLLVEADISPEEVILPKTEDWVEAPHPDLNVDRVDYALREMNRWNDLVMHQAFGPDDFEITPEGKLAMADQQRARIFAEGYLLLSQEHWSEPTHRFLEEMLMLMTKLFYAQPGAPDMWVFTPPHERPGLVPLHDMHPRDLMYVTDPAQLLALSRPNLVRNTLDAVMRSIATYRRQYVWPGRRQRIAEYLAQFTGEENYQRVLDTGEFAPLDDSEFDSYLGEYPAYLPTGFTIMTAEEAKTSSSNDCLDFDQPPFKLRQVDPLVRSGSDYVRLSQLDPSYAKRLEEHRALMSGSFVARLSIPNPDTKALIASAIDNVEAHWQERLVNSRRMTKEELNSLVRASASHIHGNYPFMTFLDF